MESELDVYMKSFYENLQTKPFVWKSVFVCLMMELGEKGKRILIQIFYFILFLSFFMNSIIISPGAWGNRE